MEKVQYKKLQKSQLTHGVTKMRDNEIDSHYPKIRLRGRKRDIEKEREIKVLRKRNIKKKRNKGIEKERDD